MQNTAIKKDLQPLLFTPISTNLLKKIENDTFSSFISQNLSSEELLKFSTYSLDNYSKDILENGIYNTWSKICSYVLSCTHNSNTFLQTKNFGELYEIALALIDKQQKKDSGQYYTPDDVATVMSEWLLPFNDQNLCDVACGTGKLILTYLDLLGFDKAKKLISEGKLFLYDLDKTALYICKTIILERFGKENINNIHAINCDFLDDDVRLPPNCKVISNPPYANISIIKYTWTQSEILLDTKELYSAFMEKIITQSSHSVIITPYSFIGASKFYSLRKLMNNYNGFIVSFDNVPGNIFCGRKHGIFNTNTSNSVRAAITVVENKDNEKGFRTSPLIRFKNSERNSLLKCDVLQTFLADKLQCVNQNFKMFYKCDRRLENIYTIWNQKSTEKLGDFTSTFGSFSISMPNTCRYFTSASPHILNRGGQITIFLDDEDVFYYIYCLINSSFVYWYWRLFDGGITYSKSLFLSFPTFYKILSKEDKLFFKDIAKQMIQKTKDYIIIKNNVGVQENIKFPRNYRDKINERILQILNIEENEKIFDIIHSNMALEVSI